MNVRQALATLDRGELKPLVVLVGEEEFLQDLYLRRLVEKAVDPATRDFNFDLFYGHEVEPGQVIEAANAYPMMAERRVVVVKNTEKLGPKGIELLGAYARKPSPTTVLVVTATKLDQRLKGMKDLKANALWVECKRLYDRQIPEWINTYAQTIGLEVSEEAGRLLHSLVGNNLRELANELEKVAINLEGRKRVEEEDVRAVVGFQRSYGPFDLNDAVGDRDLGRALRILGRVLEAGDHPTAIVARLVRHFGLLVKVKALSEHGRKSSEIAAAVGLHPFFVERYQRQAARYTQEEMGQAFEALLAADIALKSSASRPRLVLELMLLDICKGVRAAPRRSMQPA